MPDGVLPYGFRATYHHLCRSARIPRTLADDPASLVRAVEELHEARLVWLAEVTAWQVGAGPRRGPVCAARTRPSR
ncbi:hypothetical protein WKI68_36065 [Streptomyces sp. MS1.HAVA.3]|uniref:Uncharacterized protein n=1 Tax=Streptomyces caledonius TaxID=3134107 RepID=A0ABU8UBE1_9ACTN